MTQKRIVSLSVVAALGLLSPFTAWAFGLGKITVNSALNQPFDAEIPVTALRATERGNLEVRLASPSDFDRAGLDRSLLLTQLRFEVVEQGDTARVKITSQVPIKEPFLDFLVTASAGEGRMLREYTVLLDPPAEVFQRPGKPAVAPSRPSTTTASRTAPSRSMAADEYQVRRGDTLWNIAQQTRPAGDITAQQMMMALLAANPQAFQRNNINGLKADVTLQIPDAATVRQLSAAQASAAVNQQAVQWQNRNQPTAVAAPPAETAESTATGVAAPAVVSDEAVADADVAESTAQSETTENADETATATVAEDVSRLQLVAASDDGEAEADPAQMGDPDVQKLNEQLTLAQETIEAQNQENIDFKSRMDAMEEQLETMRRLLSLKDEDMARLQSILENDAVADADDQPLATVGDEESIAPAENDNTTDVAASEPAYADTEKPAAARYLDTAKAFVSNFMMEILLGLLLFFLLVWLVVRHRRQEQTWDEAVGSFADDANKQADIDDAASNAMVAPEVTELETASDTPQKTVDELVEQADMFVGYADYVQARSALDQAYQMAPTNKTVAAKMLFVLFKQNKAAEFNSVLADSAIDENDPQWPDARGWGLALMPNDPRFKAQPENLQTAADEVTAEADDIAPEAAVTVEDQEPDNEDKSSAIEFDISQYQADEDVTIESATDETADDVAAIPSLDVDDVRSSQLDETVTNDDIAPIQLDIDDNDNDVDWQAETDKQTSLNDAIEPISLDLDEDMETSFDSEAEKKAMQELDLGDAQDDLDFDFSGFDDVDEAETKLDLAAAYIDMDDPEGARGILQEVISEGSEEQKQRAQALLDTLN